MSMDNLIIETNYCTKRNCRYFDQDNKIIWQCIYSHNGSHNKHIILTCAVVILHKIQKAT